MALSASELLERRRSLVRGAWRVTNHEIFIEKLYCSAILI